MDTPKPYYKSYESDSESDSSDVLSDESLSNLAGPNFASFAKQLQYDESFNYPNAHKDPLNKQYYYPYDDIDTSNSLIISNSTQVKLPKTKEVTSLFLVDSANRDKSAYPQPTNFTLRLPRVYKNVASIQITQIKLLSSFFYFSAAKSNIVLPVIENGRSSITTYLGYPLTSAVRIDEGTYGINDLLNELQTQMNYTPLFYDFPNGFSDFITLFPKTGDLSINFNQPGDTYYDALNSKYIQKPTMATILGYYWGSRYAGLTTYTSDQIKVAYYYPVIYEILLDTTLSTPNTQFVSTILNLTIPNGLLSSGESVYSHLIFNMAGINDQIALSIINNPGNIEALDSYRLNHTFRFSLINRYELSYDTNTFRVNILSLTLNTSLVNLINSTSISALASILSAAGLTASSYSNLNIVSNRATVVYTDMYNYLQGLLTQYLGIPYATYAPGFFNTLTNTIYFQNGLYATNIRTGYTTEYLASGERPLLSNTIINSNSLQYWPNFNGVNGGGIDPSGINVSSSLIPYSINSKNFLFGNTIIDPNTFYINTNKLTKSIDAVITIKPSKYTIIKFRSPVRQTLQVETLPIPYYYRFADYNSQGLYKNVIDLNKNNVPQGYFDISYSYVYNTSNSGMDSLKYNTVKLYPTFGQSLALTGTIYNINNQNNYLQFEFIAPYPPGITSGLYVYNTNISFVSMKSNISSLYTDTFNTFLYHDRGAFMADIEIQRSESPYNYIQTLHSDTSKSDITHTISTFAGHTYYVIFRSQLTTCIATSIQPIVYYNNASYTEIKTDYVNFSPTGNPYVGSNSSNYPFVVNYNTDFLRLPMISSLYGLDPENSKFSESLNIKTIPIGYDISGVSNDLTDYIGYSTGIVGFVPRTKYSVDPFNNYIFNYDSGFDIASGSYFNQNSRNTILQPLANNVNQYIHKGTSTSQLKIVHWYNGYSIPQQYNDTFTTFTTISTLSTPLLNPYFTGFPVNRFNQIEFGVGINAIGFLPTDGVYSVSSFSFKSAIYPVTPYISTTSEDPNIKISQIGIYTGLQLIINNSPLSLSTALTVLSFNKSQAYGPSTSNTQSLTEYGTWYEYIINPLFTSSSNSTINGYTPNTNDILSYNSMYYMVPFNSNGESMTFSKLSGSLVPYPLSQVPSTGTTYFGVTCSNTPGELSQSIYIMPSTIANANSDFGPQGAYSRNQSQYQQSLPITTTSLGYTTRESLVNEPNALYPFTTQFSTMLGPISSNLIGQTAFFSEYQDNLYIVNSLSNYSSFSNSPLSFIGASYASSISASVSTFSGSLSCITHLLSTVSTTQNYTYSGNIFEYSTFIFKEMSGNDSNVTTQSFEVNASMNSLNLWLWGGGGATWSNTTSTSGGAGAYIKANINVSTLLNTKTADCPDGISTVYIVVGKGGNRDNTPFIETTGIFHGYEQPRYGGGGTSLLGNIIDKNSIALQGGGFSGIFTGSNLDYATPLLIVGGGGAAGSYSMGGPGGIGIVINSLPVIQYPFSSVTDMTVEYNKLNITSILDINGVNIGSFWNPVGIPYMNPRNYNPVPNTYSLTINFASNAIPLQKLRFYGSANSNYLPTGFVVYSNQNKTQILYSNTNIQLTDYQMFNNGSLNQLVYDIFPRSSIINSPLSTNGWIVVGSNTTTNNSIQYSIDAINWVPVTTGVSGSVTSVLYASTFSKWYATSSSGILISLDGINWASIQSGQYTAIAIGESINSIVVGDTSGNLWSSADGLSFNISNRLSTSVLKIRYINNQFWAIDGSVIKISSNGFSWTSVTVSVSGMYDIAYGVGRYIIVQRNTSSPYNIGIIYSSDGRTWYTVSKLNIGGFSGRTITYGNNVFVAGGITTDGTSFMKYSIDGVNWLNTSFPIIGDYIRNDIVFYNGQFISVGEVVSGSNSQNQISIVRSDDGINWKYSLTGGFNTTTGGIANSAAYGSLTIPATPNSIYMEIIKSTNTEYQIQMYKMNAYNYSTLLTTPTLPLIDGSLQNIFYPPETRTIDILKYSFYLTLQSPTSDLNALQFYTNTNSNTYFTGLTIKTDLSDLSQIYTNTNITPNQFTKDSNGNTMFEALFVPPLSNISSVYINFNKATLSSLQISEIRAVNDSNKPSIQYIPSTIIDTNNRIANRSLSSILTKTDIGWSPTTFSTGDSLRLSFTFSTAINEINRVQIYSPIANSNSIPTEITIYSDQSKTYQVYSNSSPSYINYTNYTRFDLSIIPLKGYSTIYMEISKNTPGLPVLNGIEFYSVGLINNNTNGFSGGNIITMQQSVSAYSQNDGGGGGNTQISNNGILGYFGEYLLGGSPAITGNEYSISSYKEITNGAGGGGGGYYGGGGGGYITVNTLNKGGAGGGGSGFIYMPGSLITINDYQVASVASNYYSPGTDEQAGLLYSNIIQPTSISYGQGGQPAIDFSRGNHGIVVIGYGVTKTYIPPNSSKAFPKFIDGSKLTLFQAPIVYPTDSRNLIFTTYSDSIQTTSRAGYNWVWYNAYLSLVGTSLSQITMIPLSQTPSPSTVYPSLPQTTYTLLSQQFSAIVAFYNSVMTTTTIESISQAIGLAFQDFLRYFINISYTASNYEEMTQIYCLLDYLQVSSNLSNPHINPVKSSIDRIFGGLPGFGYWANPFTKNVSYIGFDVGPSHPAPSNISPTPVQVRAFYCLVLEQSLITGEYELKDCIAYKPTVNDATTNGVKWYTITQFTQSYIVRSLTNRDNIVNTILAQPYTMPNAIEGRLSLFNYSVYSAPAQIGGVSNNIPIQMLNDFGGQSIYIYSFQTNIINNISTINLTQLPFTSTSIQLNQSIITQNSNALGYNLGTIVSEYPTGTSINVVTKFGFNSKNYVPVITYSVGSNNYYNTNIQDSPLKQDSVGKSILDVYSNMYSSSSSGDPALFQNICTSKIYQKPFQSQTLVYASPRNINTSFVNGIKNPYYDFFKSKYTNIWHLQGTSNLSTIYGVRLTSLYDYKVIEQFANQVFYPTHKISLIKLGTIQNPIINTTDITTYPSYPHTQLFFYNNYSTLINDIGGKFGMENTSNFAYSDMFSGYFLNSFLYNINLSESKDINTATTQSSNDSFNYLAIRGYSPSESFKCLLRFYLPQRYDFGYISLSNLINEITTLSTSVNTTINPDYLSFLTLFNSAFSTTRTYGSVGIPGFAGSNLSTVGFADFLNQYNLINTSNNSNLLTISSILGQSNEAMQSLITGDLQYILPSYLTSRTRITDPIEFSLLFSTVVSSSNRNVDQYGLGYNLGFAQIDTPYATNQRAGSFFKILDDYIYLQLNTEYDMNRLDVSKQENFSVTLDSTAESKMYNSKLLLNTFGTYSTTFVQNPVNFSPAVGKLDKLSFSWYDFTNTLINNNECEWSGVVQIVENVDIAS